MITTNRVIDFYNSQRVVPFDEVEELRNDSWNDGYRQGWDHANGGCYVIALVSMLLGLGVGLFVAAVVL